MPTTTSINFSQSKHIINIIIKFKLINFKKTIESDMNGIKFQIHKIRIDSDPKSMITTIS